MTAVVFLTAWACGAIVVGTLATWRVAALIYYDNGPRGILRRWRDNATGFIAEQLECFWCCTLWAGLFVSPLALVAWPLLLPLAFSGFAVLVSHGGRVIWRDMTED